MTCNAGTVTYTLTQEADAFVITVQRDGARAAACMLCEIEEERAGMLTRFLYENAVEPAHTSAVLHDLCGSKWADMAVLLHDRPGSSRTKERGAQAAPDLRRGGTVCIQLPHGSRFHAAVRPDPWGRGSRRGHIATGGRYWSCCTAAFARRCLCSTPC